MTELVYAVVVTFNRKELLRENLEALCGQTRPLDGIVVVDNGSTDGTKEMFCSSPPYMFYVRHETNERPALRFCEGIREGVTRGANWLWIMDDDVIPDADALKTLVTSKPFFSLETGCLIPGVSDKEGLRQDFFERRSRYTDVLYHRYSAEEERQGFVEITAFSWLGCLLRREVVTKVGYPRSDIMLWYQDNEYSSRVSRKFRIFGIPTSTVVHKTGTPQVMKFLNLGAFKVPVLDKGRLLMSFYSQRDRTYCLLRSQNPLPYRIMLCTYFFFRNLTAIALFQNAKLQRLQIHLAATWQGLRGQLGRSAFAERLQGEVQRRG